MVPLVCWHKSVLTPGIRPYARCQYREGYIIRKTILEADRDKAEIVINMEYTKDSLLLWKAVFDAQAKRSDLIFGTAPNVSPENCRFIHMNPDNMLQGTSGTGTDPTNFLYNRLGDDCLRINPAFNTDGSIWKGKTGQSARQYINYGYGDTSTFLNFDSTLMSDTNLSYVC
eukprot:SAG11_NODE_3337_length_2516_cov_2.095987_3_plen_171_part_00